MSGKKLLIISILLVCVKFQLFAQSLPVGTAGLEDYYRRRQLMGTADTNVSFTVRPIFPSLIDPKSDVFYPDSTERRYNLLNTEGSWTSHNGKLKTVILPMTGESQYNSHHPYGWNDGPFIPAKGFQTFMSGGIFLQYGMLTFQLKPEIVLAENANFDNLNKNHYEVFFARYYDTYNNIDLPVRFGKYPYAGAFWGQSSLRLNYKSLSFGISTENLWWGPGIRNSLLMSNTAPGFKHITLNTLKPLKTPVGSFEGQIIAGVPGSSGFGPLTPDAYFFGNNLNVPKPTSRRYLSGIIATWQPKWVPGLFLGFTQSAQMYGRDLKSIGDYLPFSSNISNTNAPDAPINKKDHRRSLFMRWLWPQEHAEVYFEWGQNNYSNDFMQSLLSPENSRAYIFGLRKLVNINKANNENIMIGLEVTQLQETSTNDLINGTSSWYVSKSIRHGYTNYGQVLGAGIGPGANIQSLDVSWVKGLKRIGLQIERYVHDNDVYYYLFQDSQDYTRHWVDLSLAASGEWNYKNFIFYSKLQGIKSLDYQWYLVGNRGDPGFANQTSVFNLHFRAGVSYRF